ncbi:hypothetical protein, partial [Candidatus Pelagibacter sp.]|uniref:hypothetical protein n=1 Tax=Candidatus Pelagibacter sp. TaxID=2024849 RepID=UPI003F8457FE
KKISKDDLVFEKTIDKRLLENRHTISNFLKPVYPIEVINANKTDGELVVELQNNYYFPIKISSMEYSEKTYKINEIISPKKLSLNSLFESSSYNIPKKRETSFIKLKINEPTTNNQITNINFTIGKNDYNKTVKLIDFNPVKFDKSFLGNLEKFSSDFTINHDLKQIRFNKNNIQIFQTLIFPKNYQIILDDNIEITLNNNSNLIFESDIFYENQIPNLILSSKGKNCVIFKNNRINIKSLSLDGFSHCQNLGFHLTGGINFYESDINLNLLIAKNNKSGDDLINIINSNFNINNLILENSLYDALDIDYSHGNILNLSCINCGSKEGGDGVDLSNSEIFIKNVNISNSKDKGLSIGENTNANIEKINVKNSNVCIASKDGSYTKIVEASLENCKIGLAAFNKKSYYDPSKIDILEIKFLNNQTNIMRDRLNKIIIGSWEHKDLNTINDNILSIIYE